VEIALLKPPRNYQELDDQHKDASGQSASQDDRTRSAPQTDAEKKPQDYQALRNEQANAEIVPSQQVPSNPSQVRVKPPVWEGRGDFVSETTAAINEAKNRANARTMARQSDRTDQAADIPGHEAGAGKLRLAANLQAAKEAGPQKGPDRDASPPETAQTERLSGSKARLSANLKAAKESSKETDQSHDTSRSR